MVKQITRGELRAMLDDGASRDGRMVLIEALPAAHYEAEHIPGAVNVPEVTADSAANALRNLGYHDVRVYVGGKADWAEAGLPFVGARALPVQEAA